MEFLHHYLNNINIHSKENLSRADQKKIETLLAGSLQDYYLVPLLYL